VAAGLLIVFASRMALYRFEWARSLHRELRHLLFPLTDSEIVVLAVASSVGEEMFFRGALLPAIGLVGSSAIFALLHIGPRARHLPWTASSFVVGLLFGAMFQWTGDLTGPVVAHFLVNFLNLRHVAQVELR
jgi:membrane protease YdiL (CAAX protease family)